MSNPFKDWNIELANEHNRRVEAERRQREAAKSQALPVHQRREPTVEERDLRNGPDLATQSKEALAAGLLQLAESFWSLLPKVGRFYSGHTKEKTQRRFFVLIIDHRKKLIDDSNLEAKYIIDCLRYSNLIPEDNPATCKTFVTQCLAERPEDVGIQIEIIEL
jgi:hypothetical protein